MNLSVAHTYIHTYVHEVCYNAREMSQFLGTCESIFAAVAKSRIPYISEVLTSKRHMSGNYSTN